MYSAIAANKRKTWLIMALFLVIIGGLGWAAGNYYRQPDLIYLAFGVGAIYTFVQYFVASRLALAVSGAKEVSRRDAPRLYKIVENLAITAGIATPKIYLIDDPAPNAFATGRGPRQAVVAATTGLVEMMDDAELQAVMAHELGHVRNYDIRVMTIVFGLVSAITLISEFILRSMWFGGGNNDDDSPSPWAMLFGIVAAILAPIAATMVQMAVSRRREYLADGSAALLTRYPDGLIRALEKIQASGSVMKRQNTATAHFFFSNPLKNSGVAKFFSTHPAIEDRIAELKKMGDKL